MALVPLERARCADRELQTPPVPETDCVASTAGCSGACRAAQLGAGTLRLLMECIYQRTLDLPAWSHPGCDGSHRRWQEEAADTAFEVAHRAWIVDDRADVDHLYARAAAVAISGVTAKETSELHRVCGAARAALERGCQIAQCTAGKTSKLEAMRREYQATCTEELTCSALEATRCQLLAETREQQKVLYTLQPKAGALTAGAAATAKQWASALEEIEKRVRAPEPLDAANTSASLRSIQKKYALPAITAALQSQTSTLRSQLEAAPSLTPTRRKELQREIELQERNIVQLSKPETAPAGAGELRTRTLQVDRNLERLKTDVQAAQ